MAHRSALVLVVVASALTGWGCSKTDPVTAEGYNKQEMMKKPPNFSASGNSPFKVQTRKRG